MHSNAWHDPIYRAIMRLASKATNGLTDNLCIGCHTPVGLTTGESSPTGERMSEISKNGVFCEVCHNISAITGIGNTALGIVDRLDRIVEALLGLDNLRHPLDALSLRAVVVLLISVGLNRRVAEGLPRLNHAEFSRFEIERRGRAG